MDSCWTKWDWHLGEIMGPSPWRTPLCMYILWQFCMCGLWKLCGEILKEKMQRICSGCLVGATAWQKSFFMPKGALSRTSWSAAKVTGSIWLDKESPHGSTESTPNHSANLLLFGKWSCLPALIKYLSCLTGRMLPPFLLYVKVGKTHENTGWRYALFSWGNLL